MSPPTYGSLKNRANGEYRNNHATKMQENYESPDCLFNFVPQSNGTYAIKNVKNDQYFQCHITTMVSSVEGACQKWRFLSIPDITNGFYIQNVDNNEYMTKHASQLSKSAGPDEIYIVEARN